MSGPTPGPWSFDWSVAMHDRPDLPCVVDGFQLVVAQCWDDGHSEAECEANARLIAAAPELLEALEAAIGALEFTHRFMLQQHGTTNPAREEAMAKARAAIARARGEAA